MVVVHDVLPLAVGAAALTVVVSGQTLMRARLQPWSFSRPRRGIDGRGAGRGPDRGPYQPDREHVPHRICRRARSRGRRGRGARPTVAPHHPARARARGAYGWPCPWYRRDLPCSASSWATCCSRAACLARMQPAATRSRCSWATCRSSSQPPVQRLGSDGPLGSPEVTVGVHGPHRHRHDGGGGGGGSGGRVVVALARHAHVEGGLRARHDGCDDGWLVTTAIFYMIYLGSSLAVLDAERTSRIALASVLGLAVLAGLSLVLAPRLGIIGIAIAKVAAYAVLAFATTSFATTTRPCAGRGGYWLPSPCRSWPLSRSAVSWEWRAGVRSCGWLPPASWWWSSSLVRRACCACCATEPSRPQRARVVRHYDRSAARPSDWRGLHGHAAGPHGTRVRRPAGSGTRQRRVRDP